MTTTKTAWIAGAVAALALAYTGYQYHENVQSRDAFAHVTQERDTLRDQLSQSERRAAASAERAEQLQSELQQKLDNALVAKAKPQPAPQKALDSEAEKRSVRAQKLAQLKPLLEAGMPIKGAVVVMNEGKAVSRPVEFVMGKETTVESDDGTYLIKPALNSDGSVKYEIKLVKETKIEDGRTTVRKITAPVVRQIPWEGFTIRMSSGAVLAFDPDLREP